MVAISAMLPVMTDRPTGQGDRPLTDHRPTSAEYAPVPIAAAATRLGITVNAVRQRIKRGTLEGYKTPAGWVVVIDRPTTDQPPTSATDHRPTTTGQVPTVDLAPLAAVISDLIRENRQLAEAAMVWQVRAMQAEEQLKQLTAGEDAIQHAPNTPPAAPGGPETVTPGSNAPAPWWRFWERRG